MKLYDSERAPNPRRVRWVLAEKGVIDVEIVPVALFENAHKTPEYLGKVGLPHVPALELDDGSVITESLAICRFLESLYPEPNLFGVDPRETAEIEMWTRRAEMMLATPLMLTVRHTHPALAALEKQSPEVAEANRSGAERALKLFERRLADSPFIGADRITMADIVAFIGFDFARMARFKIPETFPHLTRWAQDMRARPAAAAGA